MKFRLATGFVIYVVLALTITVFASDAHMWGLYSLVTSFWASYSAAVGFKHRPWTTGALLVAGTIQMVGIGVSYYLLGLENLLILIVLVVFGSWTMWVELYKQMFLAAMKKDADRVFQIAIENQWDPMKQRPH